MRKNFAGVIVVILVGIVICFALANLVLMTDQQLKNDSDRYHDGHHDAIHSAVAAADGASVTGQKNVNFRSLKGNRRSIEKNAQIYSSNYPTQE